MVPYFGCRPCFAGLQCVLDALRARKERFLFEDNEIVLKPSVMAFITMNPGYPGRAELPESLKVGGARVLARDGWASKWWQLYRAAVTAV